ncbi:hypothetical protein A1O3_04689 [Capronia epimyces CBS 606.96]|uniref:SnoaL-like domain-containing protein n=1 Tax=Capronia epimyces CBS 606.96 TaxID=1182542 RepID=W9XTZ8_9EURO|nr:uncharacterized protein A1O3_04689 [Capronia epimyces CBS 606.96]EXJ84022.1 hypothetical protein A1O3_04689 [Capronia epimyces CBS 606.96]
MDLAQLYTSYIAQINAGCEQGALSKFVNDGVVHNDSAPMSVDEYAQIIIDSQASFPGLHFDVETLVTESAKGEKGRAGDGTVAARIKLSYNSDTVNSNSSLQTTPPQTNKEVFYEHVFYQLEGGKISRVWSLLDGAGQKWKEGR